MYYGEKVCLRALELSDLDDITEHWNTYETRRFLNSAIPNSRASESEWLEKAAKSRPWADGELVLAIEDKGTGDFLGTVSLFDISKQHRRAEFGIAIHNPENLGKGYGTDATTVMLWIAFHVLGLNGVYLYTLIHNERAQRAYEKAGFQRVGIFRQAMFSEGAYTDVLMMDVVRDDFLERYPPGSRTGS
jgi:RimJ/RimL family protein N-acetyltransferase